MIRVIDEILDVLDAVFAPARKKRWHREWREELHHYGSGGPVRGKVCRVCGYRYMTDASGAISVEDGGTWVEVENPHPWLRQVVRSTPDGGCWPPGYKGKNNGKAD